MRGSRRAGGFPAFPSGRWALLVAVAVLCGSLFLVPGVRGIVAALFEAAARGDGAAIRDEIRGFGVLAPLVSVGVGLLHAVVPFPMEILALANGLAFGFVGGLFLTWLGCVLSALAVYGAGYLWGMPLFERVVAERRCGKLDRLLEREGAFPLLALRLIPLVPFNAICLAAGAVRAPLWTYVWTTAVGILPLGVLLTFAGSRFGEADGSFGTSFWVMSLTFLAAVAFAWVAFRRRKRRTGESRRVE
ncbi:MAG: VTT domain-containing protein [Actinomycetota bacterium]|nr:VTT domain-containing protein [Actinomycetota bacterium]